MSWWSPPEPAGAEAATAQAPAEAAAEGAAGQVAEQVLEPSIDLAATLGAELGALVEISPLRLGIWLGFVLVLSMVIGLGGPALVRLAWRLGFDHRRRLGLASSGLRLLGLLIGVAGVLRPLFERAPFLGVSSLVLLAGLATLIAPAQLRNLASGLALSTRARLREGDLVTIGKHEGTVRDIGLLRVGLRTAAGGVTHIPAADFDRLAVTVGSRRAAVPVEATVTVGPEFDERQLQALRRALWLSVYRRAGTGLVVDYEADGRRLSVRMDTWAQTAIAEVEAHVRALLHTQLGVQAGAGSSPKPHDDEQEADA